MISKKTYRAASLALFSAAAIFISSRAASAGTFNIADGDVTGLKAAITEANANGADDTIELAAGGTYTLTVVDNTDVNFGDNGLPVIGSDSAHKLAIHGNGATLQRSSAEGTLEFRIFYVGSSADVTISGLSIANGKVINAPTGGGGIYNDHGTLAMENCTLSQNYAGGGGGIFNDGAFGNATLSITNSTFSGNDQNPPCLGGGDTSAGYGGGILNDGYAGSAPLSIINSTFSGNSGGDGGGIFNDGPYGSAPLKITNSTFSQNSAIYGGGIYNEGAYGNATLNITNSTFSQNSAYGGDGGGISNSGAALNITNSTFSQNFAFLAGGAIDNFVYETPAPIQIGNTILKTGASGGNIANGSGGMVTSLGYNLSNDGGAGFLNQPSDQINTDPMLGPLQNNGGPTQTIALLPCSPAIDQGKRDTITALTTNTDQRGLVRPVDLASISNASGGDGSDIGAFEVQNDTPAIVITSISASPNALTPPNHKLRLVTVSVSASDACAANPVCKIISVTSNEPDNGGGDGDVPNDIQNISGLTVKLRGERRGNGTGRVYTITVQCKDASGNASTKTTTVLVKK